VVLFGTQTYTDENGKNQIINDLKNNYNYFYLIENNNKTKYLQFNSYDKFMKLLFKYDKSYYFFVLNGKTTKFSDLYEKVINGDTIRVYIKGLGGSEDEKLSDIDGKKESKRQIKNFFSDEKFKEIISTATPLSTQEGEYFEQKIPKYRCPKFWISENSLEYIFKKEILDTKDLNKLKLAVDKCIEASPLNYYGKKGIGFGFETETNLFAVYSNLILPVLEKKKIDIQFGVWRRSPVEGGVITHPGKLKINGVFAATRELAVTALREAVKFVFPKQYVIEPFISLYEAKVKKVV